ncbi:hypothetical protein MRX96_019246 [Rhipicephalus microplus]
MRRSSDCLEIPNGNRESGANGSGDQLGRWRQKGSPTLADAKWYLSEWAEWLALANWRREVAARLRAGAQGPHLTRGTAQGVN